MIEVFISTIECLDIVSDAKSSITDFVGVKIHALECAINTSFAHKFVVGKDLVALFLWERLYVSRSQFEKASFFTIENWSFFN